MYSTSIIYHNNITGYGKSLQAANKKIIYLHVVARRRILLGRMTFIQQPVMFTPVLTIAIINRNFSPNNIDRVACAVSEDTRSNVG